MLLELDGDPRSHRNDAFSEFLKQLLAEYSLGRVESQHGEFFQHDYQSTLVARFKRKLKPRRMEVYERWLRQGRVREELRELREKTGAEISSLMGAAVYLFLNQDDIDDFCPTLKKGLEQDSYLAGWVSRAAALASASLDLGLNPYLVWEELVQSFSLEKLKARFDLYRLEMMLDRRFMNQAEKDAGESLRVFGVAVNQLVTWKNANHNQLLNRFNDKE